MRKIVILFIFLSSFGFAQVSLSSDKINFGDVYTNSEKEIGVDVLNTSNNFIAIQTIKCFETGGEFIVKALPISTIEPNKSVKLRVTFKPIHNLAYNSELILSLTNGNEYRIDLIGNGRYTDTYYDATFNKSHQDLKDALKTIVSANYVNYGYNGARDKMYGDIDNVGGSVTCIYTGRVATFNTRSGATSQNFNCEHTWPQSLFNQIEPERADMHHLFSTDETANGKRANFPFGVVNNASWSEGGSKLGSGIFEPRDEQKGATARAMMYFVLRYQDYSNFIDSQEEILVDWHKTYAPSTSEIARNERIFFYQKNRNPMIDHPEFVERINKFGSTDTKPIVKRAEIVQSNIQFGNVTATTERYIYLTNTGNQPLSGYTATSSSGSIWIGDVENNVAPGEAAKITIRFADKPSGSYSDSIIINLVAQSGQRLSIPIQFSLGTNNQNNPVKNAISVQYNPGQHLLHLQGIAKGLNNVQVYSANGKRVFNEISTSFTDIPTIGLAHGVYFVVVNSETEVYTTKVLIY